MKQIIKCSNVDNVFFENVLNNYTCNNNIYKCIRIVFIISKINIPYFTPFTNNIPPDNDVNMVNKTFRMNYVQFADDFRSVILNVNTPTITNTTPRVNLINDQPFEPFKDGPPIVTAINNEPVDAAPLDCHF